MTPQQPDMIWIVDEDKHQLRTYRSLLEKNLPHGATVTVEGLGALPNMQDYIPYLKDPRTATFVLDQRLRETGIASYTGIELASFMRSLSDILPIYILTNFADVRDEFATGEWNVEDVISKGELANPHRRHVIVARILRRIGQFRSIVGSREYRFRTLLQKSLTNQLTNEEWRELDDLQFYRTSSVLADELPHLKNLQALLRILRHPPDQG